VAVVKGADGRYVLVDPRAHGSRVLRMTARVEFVAASGRRAQTIRATVLRCAAQAQPVRFAG
jgi:hypothetical protein